MGFGKPMSLWSMQETTGTTVGDTIGANTGTATSGNARRFNGTSNNVSFTNPIIPIGAKTVKFKIRVASNTGTSRYAIANLNDGQTQRGFGVEVDSNGYLNVRGWMVNANANYSVSVVSNICDNKWHEVMFTWDGTTDANAVKLYFDDMVNPISQATAIQTETAAYSLNLSIGRLSGGANYFGGDIDDLQITNAAMGAGTVVAWWKMDDTAATAFVDSSSNAWAPTVTGTTVLSNDSMPVIVSDGVGGYARHFNGRSDRITFTTQVLPLGAKSIRFKIRTISTRGTIIDNSGTNGPSNGTLVQINTNGTLSWYMYNGSNYSLTLNSKKVINDGEWHEVLLVWDGTINSNGAKIYVDDMITLDNQGQSLALETTNAKYNLLIGTAQNLGAYNFFEGDLKNIQISVGTGTERTDPKDLQVGDFIRAHYTAPTSGKVGTLSSLGKITGNFIPPASSATPNGDFYFIMLEDWNGQKRLCADRNIQNTISWDTLNTFGIASGNGSPIKYDLTTPLVAGYKFEESGGTVKDITNVFDGTATGTVQITDGFSGNARKFNGTSDIIAMNNQVIPIGKKSIRFKFRLSGNPATYATIVNNAVTMSAPTANGIFIAINPSGNLYAQGYAGNTSTYRFLLSSNKVVTDGQWHDGLITWDGTTNTNAVKLYVDNMVNPDAVATSTTTETVNATGNLTIGGTTNTGYRYWFGGDLDEIEIYSEVIDPNSTKGLLTPTTQDFATRLLTGGTSSTDTDDEWDQFILSSTLNGTITAGDINVWNGGNGRGSWTSTTVASSAGKTRRGSNSMNEYYSMATNSARTYEGFRPVLLIETLDISPTFTGGLDKTSVHSEDVILTGNITNITGDAQVQYRVIVNGVQKYPDSGLTDLTTNPVVSYSISNSDLNIGSNSVTLEMTTANGGVSTWSGSVSVENQQPTTNLSMTPNAVHGGEVTLTGTITNEDGDNIKYRVLVGDTEVQTWSTFAPSPVGINYTIANNLLNYGDNTVTVEVKDDFKNNSDIITWTGLVSVTDNLPVAVVTLTPTSLHYGNAKLSVSISDQDDTDNVSYRILINGRQYYPDNGFSTPAAPPLNFDYTIYNNYLNIGANEIKIEYKDDFKTSAVQTWVGNLTVTNNKPTFTPNMTTSIIGTRGEATFNGTIADSDIGDKISNRLLINGVESETWSLFQPSNTVIEYKVGADKINFGPNTIRIEVKDDFKGGEVTPYEYQLQKLNHAPIVNATVVGMTLRVDITDEDSDNVQYVIKLNGTQMYPSVGTQFTPLEPSPVAYSKTFRSSDGITIGSDNTIEVIAKDEFGEPTSATITFVGQYAGLMFSDPDGNYYSTDQGEVIFYLDFGVVLSGQTTDSVPIRLINKNGYKVHNIRLSIDNNTLPKGAVVQISKSDSPFLPNNVLLYTDTIDHDQEIDFHARITASIDSEPGDGNFKLYVKADPVE